MSCQASITLILIDALVVKINVNRYIMRFCYLFIYFLFFVFFVLFLECKISQSYYLEEID
jgi:hypothetical protein